MANVKKQLSSYRGQVFSVLNDYKQFGKFLSSLGSNSGGNASESPPHSKSGSPEIVGGSGGASTKGLTSKGLLHQKLSEMVDAMNIHLATT